MCHAPPLRVSPATARSTWRPADLDSHAVGITMPASTISGSGMRVNVEARLAAAAAACFPWARGSVPHRENRGTAHAMAELSRLPIEQCSPAQKQSLPKDATASSSFSGSSPMCRTVAIASSHVSELDDGRQAKAPRRELHQELGVSQGGWLVTRT